MNWSTTKKVFVTFEICLLTFSVYIGSAIYSAGTESVYVLPPLAPLECPFPFFPNLPLRPLSNLS